MPLKIQSDTIYKTLIIINIIINLCVNKTKKGLQKIA